MYKILNKKNLSDTIVSMTIEHKQIAAKALPGQFVMLRIDKFGERIPLTIVDTNSSKGTVDIIFQTVGKTTKQLSMLNKDDMLLDFVGPLGKPSDIKKYGTVVCIGGGVGIATLMPIVKSLKQNENKVICILGARCKDLLILEQELKTHSDEIYITTDDGSCGTKGLVTTALQDIINKKKSINCVFAIGPVPMMKAVADISEKNDIQCKVNLDSIMLDGIGMCGTCRVEINGKTYFSCVDGPEFDSKGIDFNELMNRISRFKNEEKLALDKFEKKHKCKLRDRGTK